MDGKSKRKLLCILDILRADTDDEHPISTDEILRKLSLQGILAERKSIYRDIELLIEYGYDISDYAENGVGYALRTREFEPSELKLLCDSVAAARFISAKKTRALTEKLKGLASHYSARELVRNIHFDDSVKAENEELLIVVDTILSAIRDRRQISFRYCEYGIDKKLQPRKSGSLYLVNPYAVVCAEGFYYLIGNYDKYDNISVYRVDHIKNISLLATEQKPVTALPGFEHGLDVQEFTRRSIYMYGGSPVELKLLCDRSILGDLIDRFGRNITIYESGDQLTVHLSAFESKGLINWLIQYGEHVQVVTPSTLREQVRERIRNIAGKYGL